MRVFDELGRGGNGATTLPARTPDCRPLRRLAVVGRLSPPADDHHRAVRARADPVITPLVDLCLAALPGTDVVFHDGTDPVAAVAACVGADAVLVIVAAAVQQRVPAADVAAGGGSGAVLHLSAADERLVDAVSTAHPRTAVAVVAGSAVLLERRWVVPVPPGPGPGDAPH